MRIFSGPKTKEHQAGEGALKPAKVSRVKASPAYGGSLTMHMGLLEALPGSKVEVSSHL